MKRLLLFAALSWLMGPGTLRAEMAILTNGMTVKIVSRRLEGSIVYLTLKDGGEMGAPASLICGFIPDEIVEEVTASGGDAVDLQGLVVGTARRHGLDPALVLAVVSVESAFRPDAVSAKGAQGLMQLMPGTARSLGVRDSFEPTANLDAGSRHLRDLVTLYGGDLKKALAAYNAGTGAVTRHGGVPPYKETRDYVDRVLRRYRRGR